MNTSHSIEYIHFDTIDSTNTWVKTHWNQLDLHKITCVVAQEQTAGRGRQNRVWVSPKGKNLYATLFFSIPKEQNYLENIPQVLSLACAKLIQESHLAVAIKWPNDLLCEGKKIAGILTEAVSLPQGTGVVLGIGLNINMDSEELNAIDQPATSLAQLSGHPWNIDKTLQTLLSYFLRDLPLLQQEGFAPFKERYEALLANKGQKITVRLALGKKEGICHSISQEGRLILQVGAKEWITLSSGEIEL